MKSEYMQMIANHDKTISMLRTYFLDAQTDVEKIKWRKIIDNSLDERLRLMKKRDGMENEESYTRV